MSQTLPEEVPDDKLQQMKVLKVKIPAELHLSLHTLKIVSERNISETVQEALEMYFGSLDADDLGSD